MHLRQCCHRLAQMHQDAERRCDIERGVREPSRVDAYNNVGRNVVLIWRNEHAEVTGRGSTARFR